MLIQQSNVVRLWLLCLCTVIFFGCQAGASEWPSHDVQKLGEYIHFPFQPQQVAWQRITLPQNNDDARSVPGPTDMTGVVAILTFDPHDLASLLHDSPLLAQEVSPPRVLTAFVFDWYPQALRSHLTTTASGGEMQVGLQGYDARLFVKSSASQHSVRGSFFTRIPGSSDIFLHMQYWSGT
jgi:hypothetical protein